MGYTISKDFHFSASHQLEGLPDGHPCGRLHGHNYVVRAELSATRLDPTGFVLDYGKLAPFSRWLDDTLDHRHLNDVLYDLHGDGAPNPTAESLAALLASWLMDFMRDPQMVSGVGVSETPKTWAWWRP